MSNRPPARLRLATQPADMPDEGAHYSGDAAAWRRMIDKWIVEARAVASFNGTEDNAYSREVEARLRELREDLDPNRVRHAPDDERE